MSITTELRKVAAKTECANGRCEKLYRGDLDHIADHIDQEHDGEVFDLLREHDEWVHDRDANYIQLPKDAEGVPFHVGDHVEVPDGLPSEGKPWQVGTITRLVLGSTCWHVHVLAGGMNHVCLTENVRHHHEPTVEDVLREFAANIADVLGGDDFKLDDNDELYAEYAAKLRLAGDE